MPRWFLPLVLALATVAHADYLKQGDPRSGTIRDLMLLYVGGKDHYTTADLRPYVAYLDKAAGGKARDWFYDSFLVLMYGGSPSGAAYIDGATDLRDWQFFIDTVFDPERNLAALDAAVTEAARTLGAPPQKIPIILMIPYPSRKVSDFGKVPGGPDRSLNLAEPADTAAAAGWLVEETSRRFREAGYKHLSLWGYYWMNEGIHPADDANVKAVAQVIHDRKYGFHWIPWFNAPGIERWPQLGFDFVIMQPNYAFMALPRDEQRLRETAALCRKYGMGIEMEVPFRALGDTGERDVLSDYLNHGLPSSDGYLGAVHGYYQGTLDIGQMYASDLPANNRLYRDLYLFHTGKYARQDRSVARGLPCAVTTGGHTLRTGALTDGSGRAGVAVGGAGTVWLDLGTPRRLEEARLALRAGGTDRESVLLGRAFACARKGESGSLIGEAVASGLGGEALGAPLSMRGRARLGRWLRLELEGPAKARLLLDELRVFPAGGTTSAGTYTSGGTGAAGTLTDGLYAAASGDSAACLRFRGRGQVHLNLPADRYLSRLWLHAVKGKGARWPTEVAVTLAGAQQQARLPAPAAGEWAAYLPLPLPRVRAPEITLALSAPGGAAFALDEVELEIAPNLASEKPYTLEPPKPAKYPDDGRKLTDGELSQGFPDGKTVGWMGGRPGLIVDLGHTQTPQKVRVHVEGGGEGAVYLPAAVMAWTSLDGESWQPASRRLAPPEEPAGTKIVMQWLELVPAAGPARYVRLDFVAHSWLMLSEVEVLAGDDGRNVARGCAYRLLAGPTSDGGYRDDGRKLTDGLRSSPSWSSGLVVGYDDADPTVTVDLLRPQAVGLVSAHVCGGGAAGIHYPAEIAVQTSEDGVNWSEPVVTRNHPQETGDEGTVAVMEAIVQGQARYVRLHFVRSGWCMVDEVEVYGPAR